MNNIAVPKTHGNRGAQEASVFFSLVIYCFSLLYLPVQCPGNWKNQSLHRSYSTGKNKNSVPPSVHTAQTNNSSKRKAGNAFEVLRMFVVGGKGNKFFQTFFVGWVCTQWLVITFLQHKKIACFWVGWASTHFHLQFLLLFWWWWWWGGTTVCNTYCCICCGP